MLATLPLESNLRSNAAFIVLITNVITRLLPYDNAIYLVFVAKKEAFLHTRLKASSGDPLIYVDFTTCFQSWTPCFLFGVEFISRKLENCIAKAINVDDEKTLDIETKIFRRSSLIIKRYLKWLFILNR